MKKYVLILASLVAISSHVQAQSEPPYGMSELNAYSIFYENYKTGNYDMALQFGKWIIDNKPENIEGLNNFSLPRQFERMITVYTELAKQQSDPTLKSAYLDTASAIYDTAFETFDEDEIDYFEWNFRKGRFYQENSNSISDGLDKAYRQYEKVFEMDPERLTESGDGYYVQILLSNYVSKREREKALSMIDVLEPIANPAVENAIDEARNKIFDSPEERIGFLESQLEKDPENEELIQELADLYDQTGNRQKSVEYAEKLYEVNPNFENTKALADIAASNANYSKAVNYLKEAIEITDDNDVKKRVHLDIAENYQNLDNLQSARQHAREANRIDNSWGEPYLRIASIYASAVSECTSDRAIDRKDRTVYWLVLDYYDKARNADSSVASTVKRQYQTYEPVLPSAEDKFFSDWEAGASFKIDGSLDECYSWINETTKVR